MVSAETLVPSLANSHPHPVPTVACRPLPDASTTLPVSWRTRASAWRVWRRAAGQRPLGWAANMARNAYISGTGFFAPQRVVTNDALRTVHGIDTSDEWIQQRSGIKER